MLNQFNQQIDKDLETVKPSLEHLAQIDFENFSNPTFLINKTLLAPNDSFTTSNDILNNLLAQLYMCKDVILIIANYIIRVVDNIELHYGQYNNGDESAFYSFVKSYNRLIGCIENIGLISYDYDDILSKISDHLSQTKRATIIKETYKHDIIAGIKDAMIYGSFGKFITFPAVRSVIEIDVFQRLNRRIQSALDCDKNSKYMGKSIKLRPKLRFIDIFHPMELLSIGSSEEQEALKRIYHWGNKSVHEGKDISRSVIWYSVFYAEDNLKKMFDKQGEDKSVIDFIVENYCK